MTTAWSPAVVAAAHPSSPARSVRPAPLRWFVFVLPPVILGLLDLHVWCQFVNLLWIGIRVVICLLVQIVGRSRSGSSSVSSHVALVHK